MQRQQQPTPRQSYMQRYTHGRPQSTSQRIPIQGIERDQHASDSLNNNALLDNAQIQKSVQQFNRFGGEIKQNREVIERHRNDLNTFVKGKTEEERKRVDEAIKALQEKVHEIMESPAIKEKTTEIKSINQQVEKDMEKVKQALNSAIRYILSMPKLDMHEKNRMIVKIKDMINHAIQTDSERKISTRIQEEFQNMFQELALSQGKKDKRASLPNVRVYNSNLIQ